MPADDLSCEIEVINLSNYADPNIEGIMLQMAAQGDTSRLTAIKDELRREEGRGWCQILLMTDDLAVVRWHDQFVLTLNETSILAAIPREVS